MEAWPTADVRLTVRSSFSAAERMFLFCGVFAPNPRKLLPKHVEKSCNRRRRFTGRTGADKVKWRRLWLDWDKRDVGLVKAANGTRRQHGYNAIAIDPLLHEACRLRFPSGRVNPTSMRPSSKESNCSLGVCS